MLGTVIEEPRHVRHQHAEDITGRQWRVRHFLISKLNEKVIVYVENEDNRSLQDRQVPVCLCGWSLPAI